MNARLVVTFVLALAGVAHAEAAPPQELVVLVHGFGRSDRAMRPLAKRLELAGYEVHALRYESTEKSPGARDRKTRQSVYDDGATTQNVPSGATAIV